MSDETPYSHSWVTDRLDLKLGGQAISLHYARRPGTGPTLVCLHGFGSTKEDYADLALRPDFRDRDLVCWDAPGCGASTLQDPTALSIPFLKEVALSACAQLGIERFHLLGHSMGGLTGLLLAHQHPERVLSFFDIEGNLAPEDCFLSRQILDHPEDTPEDFMRNFQARVKQRPEFGCALYATTLPLKVGATSVKPIFSSMVEISDSQPLLQMMAGLTCPKAFLFGTQNRHLSYLSQLPCIGVDVIEIPSSGHFPMYSNAPELWSALSAFLERAEQSRDTA
ncbi:MAG: alpha/beta fold hydrolase [Rhodospirillaceae bacterium]